MPEYPTLSLCQPNAWAVIYAGANFVHLREPRTHRGRVLIHASDRWNEKCWEDWASYGVDVPSRECMEASGGFNVLVGEAWIRNCTAEPEGMMSTYVYTLTDPVPYSRRHECRRRGDFFWLTLPDDPARLFGSAGDGAGEGG